MYLPTLVGGLGAGLVHPCVVYSDPTGLFKELNEAKFDPKAWAELTMAECLPYDYKQFDGKLSDGTSIAFGGSAILVPLQSEWLVC